MGICIAVSLAVHVGIVLIAPDEPAAAMKPRQKKVTIRPVPVQVRANLIKALEKKPEPVETKKPEPVKPKEKKKVVKKPKQVKKAKKPQQKTTKPAAAQTAPPKKAAKPKKAPVRRKKPAPFVLKNVALKGGVAVQTGEDSNIFGDPSKDAKGFKKGIDAPMAADGDGDGDGDGPAKKKRVVIKRPKALNDVKGIYPPEYRDLRRVVRVKLILTIGKDGSGGKVRVKKGAEPEFNKAAIRAVKQLKFEPATKDGRPIGFNLKWTVVFIPEVN